MRRICELEDEPPGAAAPGDFRENGTSGVVCSPGVSVSPRKTRPLGEEDETSGVSVSPIENGTSGVSFIKEAEYGFEGFLEE